MKIDLYSNIRKRRKELGLTQSELAKRMHYSDKSMIAKIEKGIVDLPQSKITAFADALLTTPAALMGWTDGQDVSHKVVRIPLCTGIENGIPVLSESACELSVGLENDPGRRADFIMLLKDAGESAQTVYIHSQTKLTDGCLFAFHYRGKVLIRRPYRYAGGSLLLLRSDNPAEADIEVAPEAGSPNIEVTPEAGSPPDPPGGLLVIGRVVAIKTGTLP